MNSHTPKITRASLTAPCVSGISPQHVRNEAGGRATIADASKVSSRDFLDAITGRSDEIRAAEREQTIQRCIRAIQRGDTYGFPPMLVDECKAIMAETGWAKAERSAFGMGAK